MKWRVGADVDAGVCKCMACIIFTPWFLFTRSTCFYCYFSFLLLSSIYAAGSEYTCTLTSLLCIWEESEYVLISRSRCSRKGSILITFISFTSNEHNASGRRTDDVEMNERLINVEGLKDLLFFFYNCIALRVYLLSSQLLLLFILCLLYKMQSEISVCFVLPRNEDRFHCTFF